MINESAAKKDALRRCFSRRDVILSAELGFSLAPENLAKSMDAVCGPGE
eukprot:CAMPEP_0205849680 /NCGR_PEP_ID=MMETSP1019-20131125/30377_1 /ASSEMBLY_ACC=CAM_ASM_000403 /TAXON_ID=46462 /ORGANISM="Anophryoides haemophila, Strain AH6" /LENGTH=48 /DNA_ID= /DNA_START= /DNA_END= /DNA_ORIENTATION=